MSSSKVASGKICLQKPVKEAPPNGVPLTCLKFSSLTRLIEIPVPQLTIKKWVSFSWPKGLFCPSSMVKRKSGKWATKNLVPLMME